ncbi:MAG: hypothetical protein U1E76_22375 [Planctomycetota bacterium]
MGFIKGAAFGALAMYFLDPDQGERRKRDLVRSVEGTAASVAGGVQRWLHGIPQPSRLLAVTGLVALGIARRGTLGAAMSAGGLAALALLERADRRDGEGSARLARSDRSARTECDLPAARAT